MVAGLLVLSGTGAYTSAPLAAQSASSSSAVSRITEPIDESRLTVLSGNVHPLASVAHDQGAASQSTATGRVQLVLSRSKAQQQALVQYLSDVQNPHSSSYHKWLTPTQFAASYGVTDSDLQTVEQWLQGHGFKIEQVSKARNILQFSGNFGQIQSAFHTAIHTYLVNSVQHYANVSDPQIPAALKSVIAGVGPLHDFRPASQAKSGGRGRYDTSSNSIKPELTLFSSSGTPYLYVDPADAATIYDSPNATLNRNYTGTTTYDGTGVNIGIAGDSNITMQDVTNYRVAFLNETSSTANTPTVVIDGQDPGITNDEAEALLDTEISGGIAPKASVYLYTAADTDLQTGLFLAIDRALDDNTVSILNISFGECEAGLGASDNEYMLEIMTQAAAQGISVTVSTGDSGSAGCDSDSGQTASNGLAVNGIASTPYNIAVGGTDYDVLGTSFSTYVTDTSSGTAPYYGTALSYIPEEPWNNSTYPNTDIASNSAYTSSSGDTDIEGGGGGASSCVTTTTNSSGSTVCASGYSKPAFQSSLTPADGVRDLPDVSFLAANAFYGAVWVVCADSTANGEAYKNYTDCETTDGAFTSSTSFSGYGGTSAAAPTMAGILALVEQKTGSRLGQADYVLYQLANSKYSTVFHDVTEGDNSVVCTSGTANCNSNGFLTGYDAGTGYDQASGLGSIDVTQLLNNWDTAGLTNTATTFNINGSTAQVNVTHGTSLTFNVGVTPTTATGVVGIVDTADETSGGTQNNAQTNIALSGGSGSTSYNGLPGGSYNVSAYYGGDSSDAASTSSSIPVTISSEASTTALTLSVYSAAGSNPAITTLSSVPYGSYYYADVQIYGTKEGSSNTQGLATGSVGFTDNGSTIQSGVSINSANQAFYDTPTTTYPAVFSVGSHSLAATYAGDASYQSSSSTAIAFTVVKDGTTVTVSPASKSINSQASDQVTVLVNTTSVGAYPTGTITLTANGATLASVSSGFSVGTASNGGVAISTTMSVCAQHGRILTGASPVTSWSQ
jgi:subtilase family serine protease